MLVVSWYQHLEASGSLTCRGNTLFGGIPVSSEHLCQTTVHIPPRERKVFPAGPPCLPSPKNLYFFFRFQSAAMKAVWLLINKFLRKITTRSFALEPHHYLYGEMQVVPCQSWNCFSFSSSSDPCPQWSGHKCQAIHQQIFRERRSV